MNISTFALAIDPDNNKEYIYQCIDEADRNHTEKDTKAGYTRYKFQ